MEPENESIMIYMVQGKDFWELQKRILSRKYLVPLFETLGWENILKEIDEPPPQR